MVVGTAVGVVGGQAQFDAVQQVAIDLVGDIGVCVDAVVVAAGIMALHLPQQRRVQVVEERFQRSGAGTDARIRRVAQIEGEAARGKAVQARRHVIRAAAGAAPDRGAVVHMQAIQRGLAAQLQGCHCLVDVVRVEVAATYGSGLVAIGFQARAGLVLLAGDAVAAVDGACVERTGVALPVEREIAAVAFDLAGVEAVLVAGADQRPGSTQVGRIGQRRIGRHVFAVGRRRLRHVVVLAVVGRCVNTERMAIAKFPGQFLLQRTAAVLAAQRGGQRVELALRGGLGVEVAIEVEGIGRAHVDRTTDRIARHVRGGRFGHLDRLDAERRQHVQRDRAR